MGKRDERIDAYIAKSADFAQPILKHLRELVHTACPEVEETMKWSFPHFDYKGIMCNLAAFKQHCNFGLWKQSLMIDPQKFLTPNREALGQLDQIKSLKDLPPDDVLMAYIKEAAQLNEEGVKLAPRPRTTGQQELEIPDYFTAVLRKNQEAAKTFENFRYSHKKEYVEWITEAKTEETRNKRLTTAMEWLAEGKSRHWKYAKK